MSDTDSSPHLPRSFSRRDVMRFVIASAGLCALGPLVGGRRSEASGAPRLNFKRLVVINMVGGADTLNLCIPVGLSAYYSKRGTLAIQSADALQLNGTSLYRLHPSMPKFANLWNSGDALTVQRVGYPVEDLSHFVSSDIYSLGVRGSFVPLRVNRSGWIARYADNYAASPLGSVSIGMGRPLDFVGGTTHGLTVNNLAGFQISAGLSRPEALATAKSIVKAAVTAGLAYEARAALVEAYDLADEVQTALANHDAYIAGSGITYPTTGLARQMSDVAALIHGGFDTRIFYTGFGGFDTHSGQGTVIPANGTLAQLLVTLDGAIGAFADEMKLLGVWDDVAIVVITEFGRRTDRNGSGGTDHGHAYSALVAGGSVHGGASYGPDLTNNDMNATLGYPSYAVDFRSIYKELIQDHLGADPAPVFPEALQIESSLDLV